MAESTLVGVVMAVVIVVYLLLFGIVIADYVISSWSLQTLAKRRSIPNPWLAWIPIAGSWILGCIAQDYDERNGIKRNWAKILLGISIALCVAVVLAYIAVIIFVFYTAFKYGDGLAEPPVNEAITIFAVYFTALMIAGLVSVAYQVCAYICFYKLFESTVPEKSLKYMILSVLIPLAGAICLFKCKDKGYSKPELTEPELELPEINQGENQ